MSGTGAGGNPIAGYAVVKSMEPKPGESIDVQAEQAALDVQELRELEADLYGPSSSTAPSEDAAVSHGLHLPHPHLPKHG